MDKNRKARLLADLKAAIGGLPPRLKVIAKYIIDNPGDFGMDPIRVSAEKIGVSPNSLVRLAQKMGFDGFEPFRDPFRHALVTEREDQMGADWIAQLDSGDSLAQTQGRLARNEINIVSRSLRMMSQDRIETALRCMTEARNCYVTATRSSYAMAYYFHYVGRMALPRLELVPRHMGAALDDLLEIGPEDCLIALTFAPYSASTIQALRLAGDRGAKVILISDSEVIAPGIRTDHVLAVAANSLHPFGAIGGAMAVLECLLTHLIEAAGPEALRRIEAYDALRQDSGAYWSGPKLPRVGS